MAGRFKAMFWISKSTFLSEGTLLQQESLSYEVVFNPFIAPVDKEGIESLQEKIAGGRNAEVEETASLYERSGTCRDAQ